MKNAPVVFFCLVILAVVPASAEGNCTKIDDSSRPDCPQALVFFKRLKLAIKKNDRQSVASMIHYPLLTTAHDKPIHIRNRQQLLSRFNQIFDPEVRCAILDSTEKDVWGNLQGFTIGGGAVWFDGIIPATEKPDLTAPGYWTKYPLKIVTVNNGSSYDCRSRE